MEVVIISNSNNLHFLSPFQNINQNKRTLLPKFYGLYCVQAGGKNIRIVVMNNLLPRIIPMHLKYDLKGSTYKRRASPKEREKTVPTYKDLDFIQDMPDGLLLEADNYNALCKTIQRDCLVSLTETLPLLFKGLTVVQVRLSEVVGERWGLGTVMKEEGWAKQSLLLAKLLWV